MIKIRYKGTRPMMLPDGGGYIYNDETRKVSDELAERLLSNSEFEIAGSQNKEVVSPVEEVFTDPSVETLEAALTEGNVVDDAVEGNKDQAEDDEETDDAE